MANEMENKAEATQEELFGEDLRSMVRFTDMTKEKPAAAKAPGGKYARPEAEPAEWESAEDQTEKLVFPDKLMRCGKWALAFGGIQAVLFWWLQAGLVASEAAWPGMVVCAALGGLTVGWNAK